MTKEQENQIITSITQFVRDEDEVGMKYDSEKPDYSLLPPNALEETVKVLTFGAKKYSPGNWKKLNSASARYFAAAQRHMWALQRNEENDPESGYHHAAHAACCLLFILEIDKTRNSDIIDPDQLTFNI
jgi:hypothetical protein